eukprot:691224_1
MEQKIIFRPRKIRLQSNNLLAQQLAPHASANKLAMEQKIIFRPRKIRLQSNNLLAQQLANQMEELDKFIARSRLQLIARSLEKQLAKRMDEAMLKKLGILGPNIFDSIIQSMTPNEIDAMQHILRETTRVCE